PNEGIGEALGRDDNWTGQNPIDIVANGGGLNYKDSTPAPQGQGAVPSQKRNSHTACGNHHAKALASAKWLDSENGRCQHGQDWGHRQRECTSDGRRKQKCGIKQNWINAKIQQPQCSHAHTVTALWPPIKAKERERH